MVRDGGQEEERERVGRETNAAKESCAQSEFCVFIMLYQCNGIIKTHSSIHVMNDQPFFDPFDLSFFSAMAIMAHRSAGSD